MGFCNGTQTSGNADFGRLWDGVHDMTAYDTCGDSSYLRPDTGGSPMPWHFVTFLLVTRLLLVFIRIARWDKGQIFALLLAMINAFIITLAFFSTGLAPDKITIWSSIILVGDAGAVEQVAVLLLEKSGADLPLLHHVIIPATVVTENELHKTRIPCMNPRLSLLAAHRYAQDTELETGVDTTGAANTDFPSRPSSAFPDAPLHPRPEASPVHSFSEHSHPKDKSGVRGDCFLIIIAFLVLTWILALQITSIVLAAIGLKAPPTTVKYCAPIFLHQTAIQTSECVVYRILDDFQKGIGCIMLEATMQRAWLHATKIFVSVSLAFELLDLVILLGVNSKYRVFGGAKLKRPWFTMFAGIGALVVIGALAIFQASNIPNDISHKVLIASGGGVNGTRSSLCLGGLHAAGLRGENIAYWDGVFSSFKCTWYGCD